MLTALPSEKLAKTISGHVASSPVGAWVPMKVRRTATCRQATRQEATGGAVAAGRAVCQHCLREERPREREEKERMGSSELVRWGAIGLLLGGVVWVVLGLLRAFDSLRVIPGREDVVLLALALVLTAAGLVGPHVLQRERYGLL